MNVSDFIKQHFHESAASVTAATSSFVLPYQDMVEKTIVGIAIGVGTWILTRTISWILIKLRNPCSKD